MIEVIRPARYGILLGLLGILFGIGWAFYLVIGHESIHKCLERSAAEGGKGHSLIQLLEPASAQAHTHAPKKEAASHVHEEKEEYHGIEGTGDKKAKPHLEGGHDNPIIELSHKRLTRGHIHLMGIGTLTILLSLVIAFTSAPDKVKTTISILTGIGGIIYPIAWIIMGYRTPALGPAAADVSVRFIAGPGIVLVVLGILTTIFFLLKDAITKR